MRNIGVRARSWFRFAFGVSSLAFAGSLLGACGDCSEELAVAEDFVADPANRACETDADCDVVGTGCFTLKRGLCSRVAMSRSAAMSSKWRAIDEELRDCDGACDTCDADLAARCVDGLCGGV
jgi:hypothetical protein